MSDENTPTTPDAEETPTATDAPAEGSLTAIRAESAAEGNTADSDESTPADPRAAEVVDDGESRRVFKIGSTQIEDSDSTRGKSIDEAKAILKLAYPEIANSSHTAKQTEDGTLLVEFLPKPGRKG